MFREMRRKRQQLDEEACAEILRTGSAGVLAVSGDAGYPYAVPLSYVYANGKLYFHCARAGHKIDAIRRSPKASFCVIGQDVVKPLKYTTYFRSVIAFGTVRILEDDGEKYAAVKALALKYAPMDTDAHREEAIRGDWAPLCMLEMTIEHCTGKECIELVKAREGNPADRCETLPGTNAL